MPYSIQSSDSHERSYCATGAIAVTPHNTNALACVFTRGLYVSVGGDVKVTMINGDVVVFAAVPAGTVLPVGVTIVWATGTTATGIIALR